MSENDEKKARLEAIRAANRAKAAAEGGAAAAPPVEAAVAAPVAAETPATATNMSDDKAARLAAIRAANAAKAGDAPAATATTTNLSAPAPAAAAPRAAAPAAAAARPVAKPALPPRKQIPRLYKVIGGAVFMTIVFVLLATTTKQYLLATIFGVVLGGAFGLMFGSLPPGPGDEVTGGE